MKCADIMRSPPTRLYVDDTVHNAIGALVQNHMYNLPVVDHDEVFAGELSARRLIGLLLPGSVTMERGLTNVGFIRESVDELLGRLNRVRTHPVSEYMATDIEVVYPDSPLIDALNLLYKKYIRIPVVDPDTRRLVGGISFITLLRRIEDLDGRYFSDGAVE